MEPPELEKVVGRSKIKRVRKKDEARREKRKSYDMQQLRRLVNTRPRKRSRELIDELEEINLTTSQSTQANPIVQDRIPNDTPDFELAETSKQRSSKPDATTLQHTVHPVLTINFPNHDPDPNIRPTIVSESTIFRARQQGPIPSGTRNINFVGDHNGVSVPSNLPEVAILIVLY
ncbi:hypothetical protein KY290_011976 [Solanum tuberosum]|uniref:Uncharacterized protein n=1 Tax=Solanum tuberosum TaxID=4113 RepID=A0ABQ7W4B9_SOLTU|nr:hypothetical protein KY289_012497 [Solanum tuberosum]KAH0710636.1 hypothetical protein KY284_012063 [Solanum tuberosum]KAH0736308.1 hypothetical protein KY285_012015 [Solanum tuberosum]KAH0774839.1 hypothetical protein KY290_011976 [Solanum tuberosum]